MVVKQLKIGIELKKWGNSIGLRIPAGIVNALNLAENTQVDLTIEGERLIIEKQNSLPTLAEILDSIPEDFQYPEDISEFVEGQTVGEEML